MAERSRLRYAAAVCVGLVLADSSVVVLALPEIYRDLDVSVSAVTWVLISFNLVLAATAVPAAAAARGLGARWVTVAGLAVFALASLVCGLAGGIELLIAARCLQALGGAAAVCGALELLPSIAGGERNAARTWAAAGALGAALGPGLGGLLTEVVSWQSIFFVQVPIALGVAASLMATPQAPAVTAGSRAAMREASRPHLGANLALALVSAALAAALFLLVLLLIEGWRLTPIATAAAVSATPLFALAAGPLAHRVPDSRARAAAGSILIGGGLAGLALLPDATVALTLPPQALVGAGLTLTLSALTETALEGRSAQAIHGGWTIAARHAGVVAGLLVLTPVFTADLEAQRRDALASGTAALLDARISIEGKLELTSRIEDRIAAEGDKVPILDPAFEPLPAGEDRAGWIALRDELEDEVESAATHAFTTSFLIAAGFALVALVPIGLARREVEL